MDLVTRWLERLERVAVRPRSTFDSSATPKPGTVARRPRLAPIDVDRLRQQLQPPPANHGRGGAGVAVDELSAANRRIADLERTVQQLRDQPAVVEIRDVPVLDDATREQLVGQMTAMTDLLQQVQHQLASVPLTARAAGTKGGPADSAHRSPADIPSRTTRPRPSPLPAVPSPASARSAGSASTDAMALRAGARRMLAALASRHPAHLTRAQLATLAKMRPTSGTYSTYLSDLRRHGYLEETDGRLQVTDAGRTAVGAGPPTAALTASEVREQWRSVLRAGARRMLDTLVDAYPRPVTRTQLGDAAELSPSSGTFGTYLSDLRRNGLSIENSDGITATDILFTDPAQGEQ